MTLDIAAIKQRQRMNLATAQAKVGNRDFFKFRECKNVTDKGNYVRIIFPPYLNQEIHDVLIATRRFKLQLTGYDFGKDFYSPTFYGQPDPVRLERERLQAEGRDEEAKELAETDEYLGMLVDIETDEGFAKGVQPFKLSLRAAAEFMDAFANEQYGLIWDPMEGFNLRVRRTGTGWDTRYKVTPDRNPCPLKDAERLLSEAKELNLFNFITVETEETLLEAMADNYDKDTARERRKERNKAIGNPVLKLHLGEDSPSPFTNGEETDTAENSGADSPASPDSMKAAGAGGSTKKAAPAASAAKGAAVSGRKTGTAETIAPTQTQSSSDTSQTTSLFDDVPGMRKNIGAQVRFVDMDGSEVSATVTEVTRNGSGVLCYVVKLPSGEEGLLNPQKATFPEPPQGTLTADQRQSYAQRLKDL